MERLRPCRETRTMLEKKKNKPHAILNFSAAPTNANPRPQLNRLKQNKNKIFSKEKKKNMYFCFYSDPWGCWCINSPSRRKNKKTSRASYNCYICSRVMASSSQTRTLRVLSLTSNVTIQQKKEEETTVDGLRIEKRKIQFKILKKINWFQGKI